MTERTDVVARIYDAMHAAGPRDAADADRSVGHGVADGAPAVGRQLRGIDGFGEFAMKLIGSVTSAVEVEQLYEAGNHVVQSGRTRGTVNATGAEFDVAETHVWEVRDGKVCSLRSYIDTPAMLEALGAG